ncbi:unnamed protein product [Vitrella brassicaformis CCMP3155]|uniref:Uncharacterized protein n=2 Tax=Vitrella brassicaformis TaxID=1169539 RepID=A0A0G4G0A1_VITBC|nr:unnamed protein product [Vitrella brassicaformis CCMP3155]|eukprot:CEM21292.1 unnamed protein product [Vitrella brassicaformis CCMP3155]
MDGSQHPDGMLPPLVPDPRWHPSPAPPALQNPPLSHAAVLATFLDVLGAQEGEGEGQEEEEGEGQGGRCEHSDPPLHRRSRFLPLGSSPDAADGGPTKFLSPSMRPRLLLNIDKIDEDRNLGKNKGSMVARHFCDVLRSAADNETLGVYWDTKRYSYCTRRKGQQKAWGGRFKPARWTVRCLKKSLSDAVRARNMMASQFGLPQIDMPHEINDGGPSVCIGDRAVDGEERVKRLTSGGQRKDGQMQSDSDWTPKNDGSCTKPSTIKPSSTVSATKKATCLLKHLKTSLTGGRRNGDRGPVLPALGIYWSKTLSRFTVQFTVQKRTYYGKGVVPEDYTWDQMRDALFIAIKQRNQLAESLNIVNRLDGSILRDFHPPIDGMFQPAENFDNCDELSSSADENRPLFLRPAAMLVAAPRRESKKDNSRGKQEEKPTGACQEGDQQMGEGKQDEGEPLHSTSSLMRKRQSKKGRQQSSSTCDPRGRHKADKRRNQKHAGRGVKGILQSLPNAGRRQQNPTTKTPVRRAGLRLRYTMRSAYSMDGRHEGVQCTRIHIFFPGRDTCHMSVHAPVPVLRRLRMECEGLFGLLLAVDCVEYGLDEEEHCFSDMVSGF